MIIKSVSGTFGKLENEKLSFHEGLNVITAPNESGKSTWCALIRALLYGVDSSERAKNGYLPDKQKYAPWSGAPMEGSMDLIADGCEISISRRTRLQNAPMRDFRAVYTGTARPVEGLNGSNAGEQLTGVSRDIFRRSAFVEQGTLAVGSSEELEKRITALVTTGEEQVSFTEADGRLRAQLRRRRYNRSGLLPELEAELDAANRKLDDMRDGAKKLDQLERELSAAKRECEALERQITETRKTQRRSALQTLNEANVALEESRHRLDETMTALADRKDRAENSVFGLKTPEEAEEEVRETVERVNYLEALAEGKRIVSPIPFLLCLILAAAAATVYLTKPVLYLIIAAGVMAVAGIFLISRYMSARNTVRNAEREAEELLRNSHAASVEDLEEQLEEHKQQWELLLQVETEEKAAERDYSRCQTLMSELQQKVVESLDFSVEGSGTASGLAKELKAKQAAVRDLSDGIARLKGILSAAGEKSVIESSIGYLQERYERLSQEYDAIALAEETLKQADAELQNRFAPKLGKKAAEYMAVMTGGKYDEVLISKDFKAVAKASGDLLPHESEYLSAGTADLLYLAVRLAICDLALPEGEPCPLIVDDALGNLDEERTQRVMELFREIAKKRQVILFSCK